MGFRHQIEGQSRMRLRSAFRLLLVSLCAGGLWAASAPSALAQASYDVGQDKKTIQALRSSEAIDVDAAQPGRDRLGLLRLLRRGL